jgi:hypothetical protein
MLRRRIHGGTGIAAVLIATGLLVPAGAAAAPAAPGVTTGPAANIAQSTATLTGRVNPNEAATTYYFQYGTTRSYGTRVPDPPASAGSANRAATVTADIAGLAPSTTYHYRLVARNAKGTRRGTDRTFRTQRQPLGLSLSATSNPVSPGGETAIAGALSGSNNADRQVRLQANPFPYTQGFMDWSDIHLTNADGSFTFPILSVSTNTQYRVVLPNVPSVQSPIVSVGVAPTVSVKVRKVRRTARGAIFRFTGTITPAHDGTKLAIQRLKDGNWATLNGMISRHRSSTASSFRKSLRLRRGGTFRVYAGIADGDHVPNASRSVRLRVR